MSSLSRLARVEDAMQDFKKILNSAYENVEVNYKKVSKNSKPYWCKLFR